MRRVLSGHQKKYARFNKTHLYLSFELSIITVTDNESLDNEFERLLRAQHAEGRIDADTLKTLLVAYRKALDDDRSANASRTA